jgi:hypothetical protein
MNNQGNKKINEKRKRIQFEAFDPEYQEIKNTQVELGKPTVREVISLALRLLFWFRDQKKKGRRMFFSDEDGGNKTEVDFIF